MQNIVRLIYRATMGVMLAIAALSCENSIQLVTPDAYLPIVDIKGTATTCAVVLKAQQGMSYTMSVTSDDQWAKFSNGESVVEGSMPETATEKVVHLYFAKNPSGIVREARVEVLFANGAKFELSFRQLTYDNTIALSRDWAELPVCKNDDGYIYHTHYGATQTKSHARNFTYCFDPSVRASIWVAYPLHSSYVTGPANRDYSSFGYDPLVENSKQANLTYSYKGRYDRGHQLPAADRDCTQQMMDQTFYATNMTPQQSNFNQKVWAALEGKVRGQICSDTLYVVTGAWFEGEHHSSIATSTTDNSGNVCPTPTHYFKALLRTERGNTKKPIAEIKDASELRAIAVWMEHADTGNSTTISSSDFISVNELEEIIGFDLFPAIDDAIEEEVEQNFAASKWGLGY